MNCDARLKLAPGVNFQSLGEGEDAVLLSMESSYLYRCNHTAVAILEMLEQGLTFGEMVQQMANRYGVESDRVQQDLEEVVQGLMNEQLVVQAA